MGWGPDQRDADAAGRAVAAMTLEQKAGQVLLPFFTGLDAEAHARTVERLHLAGSIIMGDNVPGTPDGQVDTAAMRAATDRLQRAARADGRGWPGLVGVDQEGGTVARLRAPLTEWPAPMSYGAAGNGPLAADAGRAMSAELAGVGFNVDFGPTADVTMGPADPTIGARSISGSADTAAAVGTAFAKGMLNAGVVPAAKHFPGHGSVTVNSHEGLPVQGASLEQLRAKDLKPFQAAIDAGLPMVMTGHIAVKALQPGVPASVSPASYAELRRMGFKGVAVTDALNMGAIVQQYPNDAAAPLALAAGADLVLMPASVDAAHAAIVNAVRTGTLPAARLNEAAQRVATMQLWRGRSQPAPARAPGSGSALSEQVSQQAITVLAGPCNRPIIPASVRVSGGSEQDRARFAAAARRAGIGIGAGPLVTLIGYGGSPATADVAVSLDAPWPLEKSVAPAKIALYGRSQEAFDALLGVLAGAAAAPGKLPVAVGTQAPGTGCP
ncbi:glycoside hydrolase family 3 protein [Arthrobacter sp. B3I4]|uniref:glycoside hydrolase family 3 protein n=1 Tax=Arthrobacter sp. B3I4 TaxID=3042267 RepID=UPI00277F54ED|nr:glycoside hydrolase family 3 N-terminal domain-containing protein [Arthrobacter sp. B3I4]MDQ0755551.1 beta-N-acetylhexosaminidase [Arthrobacter sp. B3I4]